MSLTRLCAAYPALRLEGDREVAVETVTVDSRRCGPGALFVAVRGAAADGHDHVAAAIAAGSAAVAIETARRPEIAALDLARRRPAAPGRARAS